MIVEFAEVGCGGKRAVTFSATNEEEDALILHIHRCWHTGTIKLLGNPGDGENTFGWVHPVPETSKEKA